jgi:hypothetical protein
MSPAMHDPMLQFFEFAHLPTHLQQASIPFYELACSLVATLPRNPERTVALRKLLEAKDCAVRAKLYKEQGPPSFASPIDRPAHDDDIPF